MTRNPKQGGVLASELKFNPVAVGEATSITFSFKTDVSLFPGDTVTIRLPIFDGPLDKAFTVASSAPAAAILNARWTLLTREVTFDVAAGIPPLTAIAVVVAEAVRNPQPQHACACDPTPQLLNPQPSTPNPEP